MWSTNPMPSSHRVLLSSRKNINERWPMSCVQRQRTKVAREQKEWNTKNLRKFAHMVLIALAWSSNLSDQLWREAPLNRAETACVTRSGAWCPLYIVPSWEHIWHSIMLLPLAESRRDLMEMWFEDCQESSKREVALWKMGLQEQGVRAVLVRMVSSVSTTVATEGKCSGSSDLPVVQDPAGDGWDNKDPVTLRVLTENYREVLKEILS